MFLMGKPIIGWEKVLRLDSHKLLTPFDSYGIATCFIGKDPDDAVLSIQRLVSLQAVQDDIRAAVHDTNIQAAWFSNLLHLTSLLLVVMSN
jgi:hypothetical protein